MPLGLGTGRGLRITDRNESADKKPAQPPEPPETLLATETGDVLVNENQEQLATETA